MVTGSSTRPGLNSTQSRELILGTSLSEFMGKPSYWDPERQPCGAWAHSAAY